MLYLGRTRSNPILAVQKTFLENQRVVRHYSYENSLVSWRLYLSRYANPDAGERCHVRLLDLYLSKLQVGFSRVVFYFGPLTHSPSSGTWFTRQVVGHNTLSKMIVNITSEADLHRWSNHAFELWALWARSPLSYECHAHACFKQACLNV